MPTATLPRPSTAFVGRERELGEVCAVLREPGVGLLTVTGPGGCGKTRLAIEAARRVAAEFAGGAVFVGLDAVPTAELVVEAIAHAVGVRFTSVQAPAEELGRALEGRDQLLVLDSFEHVVSSAPEVMTALLRPDGPVVLVTSREPLHVPGEREYPLDPMSEADAETLFVGRARAVAPGFDAAAERDSIARLCRRLDGLPLAVELAAARVKLLPPSALAVRLDGGLDLLVSPLRGGAARHRTLRDTVDWSYRLLAEEERRAFERLAVFRDGATLEAIEEVCGADVDLVTSLVDKSLLRVRDDAGGPRFTMLGTLRAFAAERLGERPDAADVHRRQALYAARLLADCPFPRWRACESVGWRRRVDDELPNVRAALAWAIANDPPLAARLVAWLEPYWSNRALLGEGRARIAELLERRDALDDSSLTVVIRAEAAFAAYSNDLDAADRALAQLGHLVDAPEPSEAQVSVLGTAAWCAAFRGDADEGARLAGRMIEVACALDDDALRASGLNHLGIALFDTEPARARAAFEHAARLYTSSDSRTLARGARINVALLDVVEGRSEQARAVFEALRDESRAADDRFTLLVAEINIAMCHILAGRADEAAASLLVWLEGTLLGNRRVAAEMLYDAAGVAALRDDEALAARLVAAADAIVERLHQPLSGWEVCVRAFVAGRIDFERNRPAVVPTPEQAVAAAREVLETPHRVERTFVFSDVVRSTPLVEAMGDEAWAHLLAWHDRTLRDLFARYGGEEVDHAGDGFFVAFADVHGAVECAVAVQRRLEQQRREHGFAPQVRIGVHRAPAVTVNGVYRGAGVHTAARIAALAAASEIVASADTVAGLAQARSEERAVSLKGLSGLLRVTSIDWR